MVVVPIPARLGSLRASSWIVRLAASIVSRRTRSGGACGQLAVEGLGRGFRGDLAGLGAAHPVGDDEQRRRDVKSESSLALRWRPVSVRTACSAIRSATQPTSSLNTVSPIWTVSPSISSASPCRVAPFSRVPLVEFMSSTKKRPPREKTRAWRLEA